jgi:RNA polymerase sigma-70 factor (ECF subfamily)
MPDEDLVKRAQGGDEAAFTELISVRVDGLFAVAFRIVRDASVAEDATQQALLEAWRKLPQLRDPSRIDGWLYRLVVNASKREIGRARRWTSKLRLLPPAGDVGDASEAIAEREQLERAFAELSADHRTVVVLRHYLGWTAAEIAAELGLPPGTVASRLHYGLAAMRRALTADSGDALPRAQAGRR